MTENPAERAAKKLTRAFSLVSNASYVVYKSTELTATEIETLQEYLSDAEDDLQDVIVALVGHTFMEVR